MGKTRCAHQALLNWPARECVQEDDVFGLECVSERQAAQTAVEFWRAYFRAFGETVIEADHFCDRLA
jgi:hypothetical protein